MEHRSEQETLADVLNAYVAATSGPSHASLREWVHLYPQYERELTEFTVNWSMIETLPSSRITQEVDEEMLVLRGMSVVQNILYEQKQAEHTSIDGILKEGAVHGLSMQQIAQASQLSLVLVRKLDRRLIHFPSIPHQVIESLAHALHREYSAVAHYLQCEPTLPQQASYRAEQAPRVSEQENFFVAVRSDRTLSKDMRDHWLVFESPDH